MGRRSEVKSKIIEVSFEVEVYYRSVYESEDCADADGGREVYQTKWIPTGEVEVLTKIPKELERYVQDCALEQFHDKFNSY